jgi:hypothetical protein
MKHQLIKIMRSKSFLIGVLDGVDGEIGFSAALECLLKRMFPSRRAAVVIVCNWIGS